MSRRGAPPIEDYLRHLLAIVDALSREGSVIDVKGVSYLLGISREEAADAIADVMAAAIGADAASDVLLPLEGDPERGIALMEGFPPIRALRMTHPEAQATIETLDAIGVDGEALGGIRPKIARALFPSELANASTDELARSELAANLITCLDVLYCNRGLRFAYLGERGIATERIVEPLSVRYLFGQWVLDGIDLDADSGGRPNEDGMVADGGSVSRETPEVDGDAEDGAELLDRRRFFLINRLADLQPIDLPATHPKLRGLPWDEGGQWVRLYFTDRRLYDGNPDWTWSREVPRNRMRAEEKRRIDPDGCAVDVRHFKGSPYLARLVVACAGACTTDDPDLRTEIGSYLDTLP